ncbi:acyl carrier protein [Poritiphilus flavus]|uniref:Acyl carrier protein n=1 Tax=Poritiphilus flavus TaxID=2697053 RepID=A0A6L9EES9_9FLAO|nr:acyl carrier protein [Poritiphilus flavus]NAS13237.1 acyl carrier protein [Poritiphilus flavus]
MTDKIAKYIKEEVANEPLTELDMQEDLLGSGIIDSVGMMKLVLFLENEFDVKIGPSDMTVENFLNLNSIESFLLKRKQETG